MTQVAAAFFWMNKIPEAKWSGPLPIGNWRFRSYVLDDRRRLIYVTDFMDAMQVPSNRRHVLLNYFGKLSEHPLTKDPSIEALAGRLRNPILFRNNGSLAYGYEGETFVDFCRFMLRLRKLGLPLNDEEKNRVDVAEAIIVALAHVGIVALIDEATGYQSLRPRDALQLLLDKYLRRELAAWAKRFPDEFYIELFRLKGWEWKGMKVNRPQVVAYYTNNIIYERVAPGLLIELESRNPTDENGNRPVKHHQWLTDDIGQPALAQHLHAVLGLMRASTSWAAFMRMLDRAFPRRGQTLELNLDLEEDV